MAKKTHPTTVDLESDTTNAYEALKGILDTAATCQTEAEVEKERDMSSFKAFNTAAAHVGRQYASIPESDNPRYEVQRIVGLGICTGLLDASNNGKRESMVALESLERSIRDNQPGYVGRMAMDIGGSCEKELIVGAMDHVRKTYPAAQTEPQK